MSLLFFLALIPLAFILYKYLSVAIRSEFLTRVKQAPPVIGNWWFPYIGVGARFQEDYLSQLAEYREKHGDFFTLIAAGRRMTFILDSSHEMYSTFWLNPKVASFDDAVQEFTGRVFRIPGVNFMKDHNILLKAFRNHFNTSTLTQHTVKLGNHIQNYFARDWRKLPQITTTNFLDCVMETLFWSSVRILFGEKLITQAEIDKPLTLKAAADITNVNEKTLYHFFREMDDSFELGAR